MKFILGIDEVGRGPLAGPVTVGVVCCEVAIYKRLKKNKNLPVFGKDSKKLSKENREKYSKVLIELSKKGSISYSVVHISNKLIDSYGISFCIKKAMNDGIAKININPKNTEALLDGGLKLGPKFKKQKTIIKGDEKEKIIAWASILAKVSRDSIMTKLSKKYPAYGFEEHKGYGTKKHRKAIGEYGASDIHRKTWLKLTRVS